MKFIILILFTFLVSGCSVDYYLLIDENNNFSEEIVMKAENSVESKNILEHEWPVKVFNSAPSVGDNPTPIEGVEYYVTDTFLNHDYYNKKLTYQFSADRFGDAYSVLSCYKNFYVTEQSKEKTMTLSTSSEFLCMQNFSNLSSVSVKIEVKNPVISHNADQVKGNVYEWEITRENYETKGITLTFQKGNPKNKEEDLGSKILFAGILLFSFICFVIGVIIYKVKHQI